MKKTNSENQYAVSIKEDTAYLCLHFDHEGNKINTPYPENPIRRIQVIECEDSGRYRTWSLLQETPNTPYRRLSIRLATLVAQTSLLQIQLTAALRRIQTLEAKEPARIDDPEDAGSSIVYFTKMPPKRITATTTPAPMTDAQIKALIGQGVADVLAEIEANRTSRNGDDNHDSRTGSRRTERAACEYT
ncbi:hypothetical protein Tco_0545281 [Tanacetum coccineum]